MIAPPSEAGLLAQGNQATPSHGRPRTLSSTRQKQLSYGATLDMGSRLYDAATQRALVAVTKTDGDEEERATLGNEGRSGGAAGSLGMNSRR